MPRIHRLYQGNHSFNLVESPCLKKCSRHNNWTWTTT